MAVGAPVSAAALEWQPVVWPIAVAWIELAALIGGVVLYNLPERVTPGTAKSPHLRYHMFRSATVVAGARLTDWEACRGGMKSGVDEQPADRDRPIRIEEGAGGSLGAAVAGLDRLLGLGLFAAAGLLYAGLFIPAISVTYLYVFEDAISLFDGAIGYFAAGRASAYLIGAICVLFTVVFPTAKILFGLALFYLIDPESKSARVALAGFSQLAKWSMLDVFIVAIMVVAVDRRLFSAADFSFGILLFAAAIVLSNLVLHRLARLARRE